MNAKDAQRYPKKLKLGDETATVRLMTPGDKEAVLEFARKLPPHDLLYVRRDITNPRVIDAWLRAIAGGNITTLLAINDAGVAGMAALVCDPLSWSPHVGELRVLVAESMRGKGLGRELIQEGFRYAVTRKLKKLLAHMTVDQKAAITIFEELGFRAEALLKDQVRDPSGVTHDIVILSCDIERVYHQLSAFGDSA